MPTVRTRSPRGGRHRRQTRRPSTAANLTVSNADTTAPTSTIACDGGRLRRYLQRRGHCHAERERQPRRLRRRPDPLHDRRLDSDARRTAPSTGAFLVSVDDDRQVPRLRQRRQRRGGQHPADHDRHRLRDTTPPTSTIACNGAACAGTYSAAVTVTLSASDNRAAPASPRSATRPTARLRRRRPAPSMRPRSRSRRRRPSSTAPSTTPATPRRSTAS